MRTEDSSALVTIRAVPRTHRGAVDAPYGGGPPELDDRRTVESVVILGCLKKVYRWRVPGHWSEHDWFEEIRAEMAAAAVRAERDFDPARGVPWRGFLGRRLMYAALARYRREWSHALRQVSFEAMEDFGTTGADDLPRRDTRARLIHEALRQLPRADAALIEGLFWGGATEAGLARSLGVSQQAVNKRKRSIFRALHRLIDTLADDCAGVWL
jgi:DNA-directed RNA polymerase specialized sigma24 family protein